MLFFLYILLTYGKLHDVAFKSMLLKNEKLFAIWYMGYKAGTQNLGLGTAPQNIDPVNVWTT